MSYTLRQVSDLTGLSTKTLRRKIASGELPAIKQQGKYGDEYIIDDIPQELFAKEPPTARRASGHTTGQEVGQGPVQSTGKTYGRALDNDMALHELLKLIRKLQEENASLHEKIGELNATIQILSSGRMLPMAVPITSKTGRPWWQRIAFWRK